MAERSPGGFFFDGVIAGVIGYATVAGVIAIVNVVIGRSPFYTAALLGEAVFYGRADPAHLVVTPGPVLAFNGVYLAVFLVIGLVVAWLVALGERVAQYWYLALILVVFLGAKLVAGLLIIVPGGVRSAIPPWAAVVGAALAVVTMGAYLAVSRPMLRAGAAAWRD